MLTNIQRGAQSAVGFRLHLWRAVQDLGRSGSGKGWIIAPWSCNGPRNHTVQCSQFIGLKGIRDFTKDTQLANDTTGIKNVISQLFIPVMTPLSHTAFPENVQHGTWTYESSIKNCRFLSLKQLDKHSFKGICNIPLGESNLSFLWTPIILYLCSFMTSITLRLRSSVSYSHSVSDLRLPRRLEQVIATVIKQPRPLQTWTLFWSSFGSGGEREERVEDELQRLGLSGYLMNSEWVVTLLQVCSEDNLNNVKHCDLLK